LEPFSSLYTHTSSSPVTPISYATGLTHADATSFLNDLAFSPSATLTSRAADILVSLFKNTFVKHEALRVEAWLSFCEEDGSVKVYVLRLHLSYHDSHLAQG
jgi:hypothetical protein